MTARYRLHMQRQNSPDDRHLSDGAAGPNFVAHMFWTLVRVPSRPRTCQSGGPVDGFPKQYNGECLPLMLGGGSSLKGVFWPRAGVRLQGPVRRVPVVCIRDTAVGKLCYRARCDAHWPLISPAITACKVRRMGPGRNRAQLRWWCWGFGPRERPSHLPKCFLQ